MLKVGKHNLRTLYLPYLKSATLKKKQFIHLILFHCSQIVNSKRENGEIIAYFATPHSSKKVNSTNLLKPLMWSKLYARVQLSGQMTNSWHTKHVVSPMREICPTAGSHCNPGTFLCTSSRFNILAVLYITQDLFYGNCHAYFLKRLE